MIATDPNLWMFEYWLNLACVAHIGSAGILDTNKQRDDKGLITPRVEVKTIWSGFNEHRYPNAKGVWFDMGLGKLAFKVVTRRNDDSSFHDKVVGTIRYLMQLVFETSGYTPGEPSPLTLSDRMPYHRIARMVDTGATPSFTPNEMQDVTAMSFDFVIQIRPEKFPS